MSEGKTRTSARFKPFLIRSCVYPLAAMTTSSPSTNSTRSSSSMMPLSIILRTSWTVNDLRSKPSAARVTATFMSASVPRFSAILALSARLKKWLRPVGGKHEHHLLFGSRGDYRCACRAVLVAAPTRLCPRAHERPRARLPDHRLQATSRSHPQLLADHPGLVWLWPSQVPPRCRSADQGALHDSQRWLPGDLLRNGRPIRDPRRSA